MALCTAAEYKAWRGVTSADYDTLYGTLIDTATAEVERMCGRTAGGFESANAPFTEKFDGDGTQTLRVSNGPISSITSVKFGNATQTTLDSTSYTHDSKRTVLLLPRSSGGFMQRDDWGQPSIGNGGSSFPEGFQNIEVVYSGGYAANAIPDDLKLVCFRFVDHYADSRGHDMEKLSQAIGNTNATMKSTIEFRERMADMLAPWRAII